MTPVHLRWLPRRHQMPVLLVVVAALALAAHLGFFAFAVTQWHWTLSAIGVVALLLLGKVLVIVGYRTARMKRRRHE